MKALGKVERETIGKLMRLVLAMIAVIAGLYLDLG
jgi:hypothetical protein